ncbi:MAG: leucine--tRNA ligase [Capnocytophaga sp.]|nr:leucine--tRNA ligase [Capnocytophaga sp.]
MKYNPNDIEAKWQKYWSENQTFKAEDHSEKPKYYVLDMFPYPSGAGLHVGHPLGYIASDIVARYKRHQGFNVLHPMGYDSFGLPAEQYAIQTGQHPEKTTKANIERYREQLDRIGFSFDWSREVRTSNPDYYQHTQWIFIQLFNSWYNKTTDKAESIETLVSIFEKEGNTSVDAVSDDGIPQFSAEEWNAFSSEEKQRILLQYRLTYLAETEVNWCPALGTVLANDEIVNGVSERGGHPVIRKKMTQWSMRISAYAERFLQGLDTLDWTESLKESQRNWIGKSVGASIEFKILTPNPSAKERGENTCVKGDVATDDVLRKESSERENPHFMTGNPKNIHFLVGSAKENRKKAAKAEDLLWQNIRNQKLGAKFRRQHYIDNFIVDFVSLSEKLVIEIDGEYHSDSTQKEYDEERSLLLNEKGFEVIRFSNEEVLNETNKVIQSIEKKLTFCHSLKEREVSVSKEKKVSDATQAFSPISLSKERETSDDTAQAFPPLSFAEGLGVRVFTTRPDTIFGVSFMTLAPEHELVTQITTEAQRPAVEAYIEATSKRSERERMADVKTISGVFTGAYAEHPFTGEPIPIWIGDYVLAGYGTGAVMAVPAGDDRDYAFAKHFNIPVKNIFNKDISEVAFTEKSNFIYENSDFLNGLDYQKGTKKIIEELESEGVGKAKTNYRLRDAVFSRQRYWGEPFPVYYVNGLPQMIDKQHLPIVLPEVEKYLPTEDGQPPLGNASVWAWDTKNNKVVSNELIDNEIVFPLELNTMPGWAGSSWYWLRYMDAHNESEIATREAIDYWQNVDLYIGGSEHATGHLLYSRFWNKFLKDKGLVPTEEPFKKLINQGMILGMSAFVYRTEDSKTLISKNQIGDTAVHPIHVDLAVINDATNELDIEKFKAHPLYQEYKNAEFVLDENGKYIVGREVEKMSKSKYNVVNPDDICNEFGADTLRLYEMFLGPLEQAKPWNTAGISGVSGFLKKLWRLYFDDNGFAVTDNEPSKDALKSLHKTIKKVSDDIGNFSFNTSVSQFMICVNELTQLKCRERAVLEPLAVVISPYAPHIAEELWLQLGHNESIARVSFPVFEEKYLVESTKEYPVSFNGKVRFKIELPLDMPASEVEKTILADERTQTQLGGNVPKKIIVVPGRIINVVE